MRNTEHPDGGHSRFDEYWHLVDLWRYYVRLFIEGTTFYAAIAGGLASFALYNVGKPILLWVLLVPLVLGIGLAFLSIKGVYQSNQLGKAITDLGAKLDVKQRVHVSILTSVALLSALFFCLSVVGLCAILFYGEDLPTPTLP
ncbi:MAG: hypothetical protein AAGJ94_17520 [Pseudomonadota bacterium]